LCDCKRWGYGGTSRHSRVAVVAISLVAENLFYFDLRVFLGNLVIGETRTLYVSGSASETGIENNTSLALVLLFSRYC